MIRYYNSHLTKSLFVRGVQLNYTMLVYKLKKLMKKAKNHITPTRLCLITIKLIKTFSTSLAKKVKFS